MRTSRAALLVTGLLLALAPGASALKIAVDGNHFVNARHEHLRLIGVNRSSTEYACAADDGVGGHGYAIFEGPVGTRAIQAMKSWRINAVAIPLNEACWLGGYGGLKPTFSGSRYRKAIVAYVNRLNARGIYAVIRLSASGPGSHVYGETSSSSEAPMADADHSISFWRSVAATFKDDHAVVFHTYDEPHDIGWRCALHGCIATSDSAHGGAPDFGSFHTAGQQAIVNAIRSRGARTQPIVISGIDFAGDEGKWEQFAPTDAASALVVGFNSFDFSGNFAGQRQNLKQLARRHPVLVGGFGDTDCDSDFSGRLMGFADRNGISYLAWTWNTEADYGGCQNALLGPTRDAYLTGHPSGFGAGIRAHYRAVMAPPTTPRARTRRSGR